MGLLPVEHTYRQVADLFGRHDPIVLLWTRRSPARPSVSAELYQPPAPAALTHSKQSQGGEALIPARRPPPRTVRPTLAYRPGNAGDPAHSPLCLGHAQQTAPGKPPTIRHLALGSPPQPDVPGDGDVQAHGTRAVIGTVENVVEDNGGQIGRR
jgi:hypothetical protein